MQFQFEDGLSRQYEGAAKKPYLYRLDSGELVEVLMSEGEAAERQEIGGFLEIPECGTGRRAFNEEFQREGIQTRRRQPLRTKAKWPMTTINGGVNPDQANELREHWKQESVTGCEVSDKTGDVTWNDPRAREKDLRSRGMYDRDGFN